MFLLFYSERRRCSLCCVDLGSWSQPAELLSCFVPQILRENLYIFFICVVLSCSAKVVIFVAKQGRRLTLEKHTLTLGIVICKGICLHWRKHKVVQYFHTIAFSFCSDLLLFCFRSTCLRTKKKMCETCEQGNQTERAVSF